MAFSCVPSEIRRMFDTLDENGDGRLTLHEIGCFLNKLGLTVTDQELNCMVMGVSQSEDGSLTFDEFVRLYQSVLEERTGSTSTEEGEDELMEAFKIYDTNEDGYICCAELQKVLCKLGLIKKGSHYMEECQRMIWKYDSNSDGLIDFSEFKNMLMNRTTSNSVQV